METPRHITLRELQQQVRATLDERFALPLWVSAEIAEIKPNRSGHCYLDLVEKDPASGRPAAQARAVIWRSAYPRIAGRFEAETGRPLAADLRILARVSVSYHELYGFSLQILDIDPSLTLGDLERQRQETIARLQREGVWEMNREQPMAAVVQRVAIVSSAGAAGYRDFCKEIARSPYRFSLTLFEAFMQGDAAEESIIAALYAIAERADAFDAVVVIRGGGSRSDLSCFDGYRLCNHIAQFPLPVLTGIGHDKDTSVADMVAHTALKTPTAVAGWLVERMARVEGWLDTAALALHDAAATLSRSHLLRLERLQSDLKGLCEALSIRKRAELDTLASRLGDACERLFDRERGRLESAALLVESRSPHHILRLGFSIVRAGERALASAKGVRPGDTVTIELADGTLRATVETTDE